MMCKVTTPSGPLEKERDGTRLFVCDSACDVRAWDSVALVQEREREGNLKAISSGRILTEARGCVCARAM
jgi:hypothetical protein